jgi:hypothetical protein
MRGLGNVLTSVLFYFNKWSLILLGCSTQGEESNCIPKRDSYRLTLMERWDMISRPNTVVYLKRKYKTIVAANPKPNASRHQ